MQHIRVYRRDARARRLIGVGLGLQAVGLAWFAVVLHPHTAYLVAAPAFVLSGIGMSLFFVLVASIVLGSVPAHREGIASGTNNAMRELGGVLGVSVHGAIFAGFGGYAGGTDFVRGLTQAVWTGAVIVGIGALLTVSLPHHRGLSAAHGEESLTWETPDALPRLAATRTS